MSQLRKALLLTLVLGLAACSRGEVTRVDWQAMTAEEKILVIEAFRGHESARDAKGGSGRLHPETSEYYRDRIDELYKGGEERSVAEIWEGLVEKKDVASPGEPSE